MNMNSKRPIAAVLAALVVAMTFSSALAGSAQAASVFRVEQNAIREYQQAKADFITVRDFYRDSRLAMIEALAEYKSLTNKTPEAQQDLLAAIVAYGHAGTDFSRIQLTAADKYVDTQQYLDPDTRAEFHVLVDGWLADLDQIDADLDAATTIEELRVVRDDMLEEWRAQRSYLKWLTGQIAWHKANWALDKLDELRDIIQEKRDKALAQGADVVALDAFIVEYDAQVADAKADLQNAKDVFDGIGDKKNYDQDALEVNQFISAANQDIRNAHQTLRDITQEIREQLGTPGSGTTVVIPRDRRNVQPV